MDISFLVDSTLSSTRFQLHWKKIFKLTNKNLVMGKTHFNWYIHFSPHLITVTTTYTAKCKICNFMCEWISAVILKQIVRKRACKRLIFPAGEELAWDSQEAKWDEGLRGYRISLEGCWGVIPSVPSHIEEWCRTLRDKISRIFLYSFIYSK